MQPEVSDILPSDIVPPQDTEGLRLLGREKLEPAGREEVIYEDTPCFSWVLLNQNQTGSLHGESPGGSIGMWGNLDLGGLETNKRCAV